MRQARYVAGLDWRVVEPEDATEQELTQTEHIAACLDAISGGMSGLIRRVMSREAYGFSLHELVYAIDETTGLWRLADAVAIAPWCVKKWLLDDSGRLTGVLAYDELGEHTLSVEKVLLSVRDFQSRNYEGTSALRPLYYYAEAKRDILAADAAIMERAGRGTLVITESVEASDADRTAIDSAAENWQSGGQAWIRLPAGWVTSWDHGGDIPDPTSRAELYNQAIARVFDDELASLGQNKYGARAVGEEMRVSTQRQLTGVCEELAVEITSQIVYPLYALNGWNQTRACTITSSGFYDFERLTALRDYVSAGIIELTDQDKKSLRRLFGLR
jgi:hypothetical protein